MCETLRILQCYTWWYEVCARLENVNVTPRGTK
jgi:hypothetical protein